MTNIKTLMIISATALLAASAIAQDMPEEAPAVETDTLATHFAAADLDQNGSLNADEFVSFAVIRAEDGDEGFKDVVLAGTFDTMFNKHDADLSGGIDLAELGAPEPDETQPDSLDTESEDTPELDEN